MEFHEKSIELNITHELLNLSDSWYWFLTDTPLWRYWKPRYKLPFFKYPKSTSGGFHITTEGKNDPTGNAGGGYDVRIKSGSGGHLLFIQYKKGDLVKNSPSPKSIFENFPHEHYVFKINSTTTNQHFLLKNLSNSEGSKLGNAVVYALPLIENMQELEENAGRLLAKTKFISVLDIDKQASEQNPPITIEKDKEHKVRIDKSDMNRCEVNNTFFRFTKEDRSKEILTDIIALRFEKILKQLLLYINSIYNSYNLDRNNLQYGILQSFIQYQRYLLHYFEVSPSSLANSDNQKYLNYFDETEFLGYKNDSRSIQILASVFTELMKYDNIINEVTGNSEIFFSREIPSYKPTFLISLDNENSIRLNFEDKEAIRTLENFSYIQI
ncbi:hypothetical protein EHQ58_00990 [Leptospira ognonensis]|uniref:Uncharacterized protein n=1 Tax=Leptospira ognonensis TaxID=2484945 RepID=A0A4R9KD67_9LEPT|nr:hypothetical protein [Leptospira ognonensis]TGL63769.1 hypothetical protein EHQ58_00990 [Leptospira ognonensis]